MFQAVSTTEHHNLDERNESACEKEREREKRNTKIQALAK